MDLRILVIDDDQRLCELIQGSLGREGWTVSCCSHGDDGITLALDQPYDAALVRLNLPDGSGLAVCQRLTSSLANMAVIVLASRGDMQTAVSALRAGAHDFLEAPIEMSELRACIERSVRDRYRKEATKRLTQSEPSRHGPVGKLLGASRAMLKVYDLIRRVSASETTVLLSGESGTGKELVAQALHETGGRAQGPFVAINCAAVPAQLLESELFGHVRGSFTDAASARKGLFEEADQGTLFLDEIGEMPLEMQPKLLRVLQERQLRPVGGNSLISVRTRIIAATNRNLEKQVDLGLFRSDLYFRLNVVPLRIPPLRQRGNDIMLLAEHFLRVSAERLGKQTTGISSEASHQLLEYDWPGNVRQLENVMERAVALARGELIAPQDLPDRIRTHVAVAADESLPDIITLEQQERQHINYVLRRVNGNKTKAARLLGVDRRTLYRKLARLEGVSEL